MDLYNSGYIILRTSSKHLDSTNILYEAGLQLHKELSTKYGSQGIALVKYDYYNEDIYKFLADVFISRWEIPYFICIILDFTFDETLDVDLQHLGSVSSVEVLFTDDTSELKPNTVSLFVSKDFKDLEFVIKDYVKTFVYGGKL